MFGKSSEKKSYTVEVWSGSSGNTGLPLPVLRRPQRTA